MANTITDRAFFRCPHCESTKLTSDGAARTDCNHIYLIFNCNDCAEAFPIEVDKVIAELYKAPMPQHSNLVH